MKANKAMKRTGAMDEGVTLIELMVALLVLGVVMAGIVAGAISALRVSQLNDQRAVASNLAQAEIERLRALPFGVLSAPDMLGATERIEATERGEYRIVREITWTALGIDTDPCLAADDTLGMDALRIDVRVSPVGQPDRVSTSSTLVDRPPVDEEADTGAIGVMVRDHQTPSEPVADVMVTLTGPLPFETSLSQMTPTSGCVIFVGLEPGNYEATIHRDGYVSHRSDPQPTQQSGAVAGIRQSVQFAYAPEADLTVTAEAMSGDAVALPEALPVSIHNEVRKTGLAGATFDGLWPGIWDLWAGDCPPADPEAVAGFTPEPDVEPIPSWPDASRQPPVRLVLDESNEAVALLPVVAVDLLPSIEPYRIVATSQDDCDEGTPQLEFPGTFAGGSRALIGLPYGTWDIVYRTDDFQVRYPDVTIAPGPDWADGPVVVDDLSSPEFGLTPTPAGGDSVEIISVGGVDYQVHTFLSDGELELPYGVLEVEYLVVAGGGAGGGADAGPAAGRGGGGAGGWVYGDTEITAGSYEVTVGAGGQGVASAAPGAPGEGSSFASIATALGGGGGAAAGGAATTGGSGGGGYYAFPMGAEGTAGQGHAGGDGQDVAPGPGAGGGGGSSPGLPGDEDAGGDGGDGMILPLLEFHFAGGGAGGGFEDRPGGLGGLGGGGSAVASGRGDGGDAAPHTGGGGAGASGAGDGPAVRGGHGGSGIVIVWFPL